MSVSMSGIRVRVLLFHAPVPKAVLELLEHVTCKRAGYDYYTIGIDLEI